jgi:hypothetical protein
MACLLLAVLPAMFGPARAEVSAVPGSDDVGVLILGIIEGPDPIPQILWQQVREDADPVLILNSDGAGRGDGRPDVAMDPATGFPHVVWAYNNGADSDIAYSSWSGSEWSEPQFLTTGSTDERDPRIFIDEEMILVVWWEPETDSILLLSRPHSASWEDPETINSHPGMRPSVIRWGGTVLVASERDNGPADKEIYLSERLSQGDFDTQLINSTMADASLDVVLQSEQGRLWMDWRQSPTEFAYSEFTGSVWTQPETFPWDETSWLMLEQARLTARRLVLSSP